MRFFLIGLVALAIVASMISAGVYMMRTDDESDADGTGGNEQRSWRMFLSLALRVGLSIFLFLSILLAWKLGYMDPKGIPY